MKVAITDGFGEVIPGFEAENCQIFDGDGVSSTIRYAGYVSSHALRSIREAQKAEDAGFGQEAGRAAAMASFVSGC